MKRILLTVGLLSLIWAASAIERSKTIVYINGAKYYVHAVQAGETLYAIAKSYGVDEKRLVERNPAAAEGLKAGAVLKIPVVADDEAPRQERSAKAERKLARTFATHTVVAGETLYAVARRYEISVQTIIEENPDIDPTHLSVGERILIRRKQIGKSSEEERATEWSDYRETLNSVADNDEHYYIVQKGDTFYALSRRFGITEQQLSELNNGLTPAALKAGAMLRLPEKPAADEPANVPEERIEAVQGPVEIDFRAHCNCEPLRISLLLPLTTDGRPHEHYLEFYQGFLIGLDSVRREGHAVDLTLFDTQRNRERLAAIVADERFRRSQLIVGPVYEEELGEVLRFAEQAQVPVVSPLAQLSETRSDALFQMAPDPKHKYDKAADLLDADKRITLIYTDRTDKEFEQEVLELLGDRPYAKHTYRYEHPSARAKSNTGDLTPLLENKDDNLFVVLAADETDVDRILAGLSSADTNLRSRSQGEPRYTVLGNARWNRFRNIDRSIFFKNRVVFFSTYHAKRDAQVTVDFDRAYLTAFGTLPSLYAYRGYDAAAIFGRAMYNDIEYDLEDRRYTPLQTLYRFKQEAKGGTHANTSWMRVNYRNDFTITTE